MRPRDAGRANCCRRAAKAWACCRRGKGSLGVTGLNPDGSFDAITPFSINTRRGSESRDAANAVQVGLNQLLLHTLSLDEQIAVAVELGVESLGLLRLSLWRYGDERAGDRLRDAGLGVSSLSWAGGFTGTAGFTFREAVADGRQALREAALVGAETLVVAPGGRGGHTLRHAQRVAVDGLKFLADEAAARRIRLAVKCDLFVRRPRWTCVQTLETAALILQRVDSPWVGLGCPILPTSPEGLSALEALADRIHLARSPLPGDGALDPAAFDRWRQRVAETLAALHRGGFRGNWEFCPDAVTDRSTLPVTDWPSVRGAVVAVRQGMSEFSAVESGRRPRAW
jgi:hypothetical protein